MVLRFFPSFQSRYGVLRLRTVVVISGFFFTLATKSPGTYNLPSELVGGCDCLLLVLHD